MSNYPSGSSSSGRFNGWAIAGFIFSFFCGLFGLIFSIIGLYQIKRTGQAGRGLAIAGLVISIISMLVGIRILWPTSET